MYDDFNYITDENFLKDYVRTEQLLCPYCEGMGKLSFDSEVNMVECHLCKGKGWISHKQYEDSMLVSHISAYSS
ncbi:MAG: fructose-bisphosphate aldolase [Microcystaceae cyanobacterium]